MASAAPSTHRTFAGVEYARVGGISLKLDLYVPEAAGDAAVPLVVWIHGGAWVSGSRAHTPALAVLGDEYAVASIDYRLAEFAPFPAQIEDCNAAIRFLRAHASQYGYDPDRIGVWGASAGGLLASLLGTSNGMEELEGQVGGDVGTSSRVQAVCDFCGPSDLLAMVDQLREADPSVPILPILLLLGGPLAEREVLAQLASPVEHADAGDPPFLIVHGDADDVVPYAQATGFHAALAGAGVDATLCVVGRAGHCDFPPWVDDVVRAFFDRTLRADLAG